MNRYKGFELRVEYAQWSGYRWEAKQQLGTVEGQMIAHLLRLDWIRDALTVKLPMDPVPGRDTGSIEVRKHVGGHDRRVLPSQVVIRDRIYVTPEPSPNAKEDARQRLTVTVDLWIAAREQLRPHVRRFLRGLQEKPEAVTP